MKSVDASVLIEPVPVVSLAVVVPLYNEMICMPALAHAVRTWFDIESTQFILVDDGSADGTADAAKGIVAALPHAQLIQLSQNSGKGAAVRIGVGQARAPIVMFMDADLACDLDGLKDLLVALEDHDVAIGSRALDDSIIGDTSYLRVVMGRTFSVLARLIAGTKVRDSQCGFKAFRRDTAEVVFSMAEIDRFAFDVEILRLLRLLDYRIAEVPVTWTAQPNSTVRPVRDSTRTLLDTVRIRLRTSRYSVRQRAGHLGWTDAGGEETAVLGMRD